MSRDVKNWIICVSVMFATLIGAVIWRYVIGLDPTDILGYAILLGFIVQPLAALVCALVLATRNTRRWWLFPFAAGAVGCLTSLLASAQMSMYAAPTLLLGLVGAAIGFAIRNIAKS